MAFNNVEIKEVYNKSIRCPCGCDNGKLFSSSTGSEKECSVCDGTGNLTLTKARTIDLDHLFKGI